MSTPEPIPLPPVVTALGLRVELSYTPGTSAAPDGTFTATGPDGRASTADSPSVAIRDLLRAPLEAAKVLRGWLVRSRERLEAPSPILYIDRAAGSGSLVFAHWSSEHGGDPPEAMSPSLSWWESQAECFAPYGPVSLAHPLEHRRQEADGSTAFEVFGADDDPAMRDLRTLCAQEDARGTRFYGLPWTELAAAVRSELTGHWRPEAPNAAQIEAHEKRSTAHGLGRWSYRATPDGPAFVLAFVRHPSGAVSWGYDGRGSEPESPPPKGEYRPLDAGTLDALAWP